VLAEVLRHLRCPVCAGELNALGSALVCARGHAFDVARQGYANLLTGRASPGGVDTPTMVADRAELLAAGHFDFLSDALANAAVAHAPPHGPYPPGLVVDIGAGTGHHLAAVLRRLPARHGLAVDVAKAAARRAARAHPRAAAVVCDTWRGLPVADGCADLVLNVFAPRNGAEFQRILRPEGSLIVVTPRADHLRELVGELGLIEVDPDKDRRLQAALGEWFRLRTQREYGHTLELGRDDAARLVSMGPSAWHIDRARLSRRLAEWPEPLRVKASVDLRVYHPKFMIARGSAGREY